VSPNIIYHFPINYRQNLCAYFWICRKHIMQLFSISTVHFWSGGFILSVGLWLDGLDAVLRPAPNLIPIFLDVFCMVFNVKTMSFQQTKKRKNYDFIKCMIFSKFVIFIKYEFYVKNHTKNTQVLSINYFLANKSWSIFYRNIYGERSMVQKALVAIFLSLVLGVNLNLLWLIFILF
jgi:hypothetical protein